MQGINQRATRHRRGWRSEAGREGPSSCGSARIIPPRTPSSTISRTRTPPVAIVSEFEIDGAAERLDHGRHVLVDISRHSANDVVERMVASVVDRPLAGFVMSGGDTAARVCRMLDATCIELGGEVLRGIPWGWLLTRGGRRWPVVLKSGGFGGEDALHHALACLSGE